MFKDLYKCVLKDIVRVVMVKDHIPDMPVKTFLIARNELAESFIPVLLAL